MPGQRVSQLAPVAAGLILLLAGCSTPPWLDSAAAAVQAPAASAEPTAASSSAPAPAPTEKTQAPEESAEPTPTVEPVDSDLAAGTLDRTVSAGPVELEVHYWSELGMHAWTPQVTKPLSLRISTPSVHTTSLVSLRVSGEARVEGRWQGLPSSAVQTPRAPINASLVVPNSSIQTVLVGSVPEDADGLRLTVVFDIATEDGINRYGFSGSDTVTIALEEQR